MIAEYLQSMDAVHWWAVSGISLLAAVLLRRPWPLWPALGAALSGLFVLQQPGMFWYQQWLVFLGLSIPGLVSRGRSH